LGILNIQVPEGWKTPRMKKRRGYIEPKTNPFMSRLMVFLENIALNPNRIEKNPL
jgi:hypothetical protein